MSSRSNYEEGPTNPRPLNAVLDCYERCLEVRTQYIQLSNAGVGDGVLATVHAELHSAVMSYFEALHYHLENESIVSEFWEEKLLWTEERYKRSDLGQPLVDENGYYITEEVDVRGLQHLTDRFEQVNVVEDEISDSFGKRTVTRTERSKLDIRLLFRIARYLDQAASELGLLVGVGEPVADIDEAVV